MTTTTILVDGMTCGHCVTAVTEELSRLPGVTSVEVDLHAEGTSPVTVSSEGPLDPAGLAAAVDEAGYTLAGNRQAGPQPAGPQQAGDRTTEADPRR